MLSKNDKDGDGDLDFEEFKAGLWVALLGKGLAVGFRVRV